MTKEGQNDWLAKLAAEFPDEGIVVEERPDDAEEQEWFGLYWRAWEAIGFDRQYGQMGGESPISYLAISQYARDHGILGEDFSNFHRLIAAMDAEWLEHVDRQMKAKDKANGRPA